MKSLAIRWLRRGAFPVVFGGVGIIAWLAFTPEATAWLMPVLVGGAGLILFGLERVIPYQHTWNTGSPRGEDLGYLALTQISVMVAEAAVWGGTALLISPLLAASLFQFWPTHSPILLQIVMALTIGDFLPYLYHRASHESQGLLWRIHAIHHAPDRLYTLNFARFHPVNTFVTASLTLLPLAMLGVPAPVLFVVAALHNVHGVLSHANIDFRLGPLNMVFSMAEVHRWHHARDIRVANSNYGATLLIWDWLYGTRQHPAQQFAATDVGLGSGASVPTGMTNQLCFPLVASQSSRIESTRCFRGFWQGVSRCC